MMILALGATSLMAVQASMPPRRGIRTSISTMSGSRSAALSTASAPSPASPTTWMSSSCGEHDLQAAAEQGVVVDDQHPDRLLARTRPASGPAAAPVAGAVVTGIRARSCPPSFLPLQAVACSRTCVPCQPTATARRLAARP